MSQRPLNFRSSRAAVLFFAALFVILIFALRLMQLQIVQHGRWEKRSNNNHISQSVIDMKRGNIYDRRGTELAISVDTFSLYVYTPEVRSPKEVANRLASVLPVSRDEIYTKINGTQDYVLICKELEPKIATMIKQLGIPGVKFENHYHRYYPQKSLASNLIGFTGSEQQGLEGIELKYDKTLCGYPGVAYKEDISISDSEPSRMRVISPPMGGSNIYLTIDAFIQHTIESELQDLVEKYDPVDASAVVMDPYNGEVLGMACYPTYNLNKFSEAKPEARRNRPVIDIFEPGSCMKIFAVASAYENKRGDDSSKFLCKGYGEIPGRRIRCHGAHGWLTFEEAIAESCNGAMTEISKILEPYMIYRTYKNVGFGDPTGIETVAESTGILKPPSKWSSFSPSSLCMGHEMAVTAIQLVQAYSIIANGGNLVRPRLIKRITSADGDMTEEQEVDVVRRVFSTEFSKKLRKMLMGVVEKGTGHLARLDDYTVGGKTSTAQKLDANGTFSKTRVVCNFIGMVPAMNPKFVLLVVVNEPKGDRNFSGGKVAALPFARIADRILKHMRVPPDRKGNSFLNNAPMPELLEENNSENSSSDAEENEDYPIISGDKAVPNLKGLSLKEAIKCVNKHDLKAVFDGSGVVINQFPKAGRPIPGRRLIKVILSPD